MLRMFLPQKLFYFFPRQPVSVSEVGLHIGQNRKPLVTRGARVSPHFQVDNLDVRAESFLEFLAVGTLSGSFGEVLGVYPV